MNGKRVWLHTVLMTTLLVPLLVGCGSGGADEAPPPAAQTGDTTLFTNASLLSTATTLDTDGVIILDARPAENYNTAKDDDYITAIDGPDGGHIPGALSAPTSKFTVVGKENVLLPALELKTILGAMGIKKDSKVVIYDDTTASLGAGGRLFWMLEYLGCTNVSILNGGWDQWVVQGRLREDATTVHAPILAVDFETDDSGVNEVINVVSAQVKARDASVLLIDARAFDEYTGAVIKETSRAGHIPGAINLPYTDCYNADKTVLNYTDLKVLFEAHGMSPQDKNVIVYSTVGKRSAFIYYLARLMGYTNVANYCGSAAEWADLGLDPGPLTDYPLIEGPTP